MCFFIPDLFSIVQMKSTGISDGVNHYAHIFGFISGGLIGLFMNPLTNSQKMHEMKILKSIPFLWMMNYRLWIELIICFMAPPIVFLIHEKHSHLFALTFINAFLCFYDLLFLAILWSLMHVIFYHKEKSLDIRTKGYPCKKREL
jgi:hypothetical protein